MDTGGVPPWSKWVKPAGDMTPARPETAARTGNALQGTGKAVLGLIRKLLLPRVKRWPWLGLGWPESTAASSAAAAGVRVVAGLALRAVVWRAEGTREKLLLLRIQRNGREAARWPELSTASTSAAAGARASSESVLGSSAGGKGGCYDLLGLH